MSVHYKFKSALEYDTVTFDGLHISVKDLKNAIVQQKRIGKNTDFDLQVTNAQTKEVYDDDNTLIPKNTSLLIARIPTSVQSKNKQWEGYGGDSTPPTKLDEGGPIAKAVDLSSLDAPEDDKIKAMMSQSTQDYDPSNYMKIRGANQMGAVPPNYRCYKCHQMGHWIKDCPLSKGPEPIEIKKSTGIPLSFMVPVDGPQVQGAMMTPNGSYAVPVLDHQTYTQKPSAPAPVQEPKPEIPEDLLCSICSDLLTDAVMIPCCGNSFCDECIRSFLLDSEDRECPDCHEKDISPGTLIPNRFLRNSVANFKNSTGYVKKPVYKQLVSRQMDEVKETKIVKEVAPVAQPVESKTEIEEKTVISEADSTEHSKNEEKVKDAVKGEPDPIPEGPPGVSPVESPKGQSIKSVSASRERSTNSRAHKHRSRDESPRRHHRNHRSPPFTDTGRGEERAGTPTIDEPGMASNPYPPPEHHRTFSSAPSGPMPPMMPVGPPMQPPPPTLNPGYPAGQPMGNFGPTNGPPPNFRLPPPGPAPPPYMPPGPYQVPSRPMFDQARPPISGPPPMYNPSYVPSSRTQHHRDFGIAERRIRGRTPSGVIDDPLAAFNRMLREKDERERRAKRKQRRSYSRSRSRSRSYSRSPRRLRSRSPRRRLSRSRSRSFSISRSRSRSFSGSMRGSPFRDFSPRHSPRRRGPSRYRSPPVRSPPRHRFKENHPPERFRERDYERDYGREDVRPFNRDREHRREERERERNYDYYDNFDDRNRSKQPPPQQQQQQQWGQQAMSSRGPDGYYPPEMQQHPYPPNRYPPRDFPPYLNKNETTSHAMPPNQSMHMMSSRRFEDVAPPGVEQPPIPGLDPTPKYEFDRFERAAHPSDRFSPDREPKPIEEKKVTQEKKRKHEKRSHSPEKTNLSPSLKRKSKSRDNDSPEKHKRRKRESSQDKKPMATSEDEKTKKNKEKKKKRDKKDSEKKKRKEKKDKHKKDDKKHKEEMPKDNEEVKRDEAQEDETKIATPEARIEPEEPALQTDLYDEGLFEGVDANVVENYGKIKETSVEKDDFPIEDAKDYEDSEKDILEIHTTDIDLKTELESKNEMLAQLPEKSKWEVEEDNVSQTSPKDSVKSDTKIDKSGKVTNEVLKRAENAIFAKAINAIRPIEIKKISTDRAKLYSGENDDEKLGDIEVKHVVIEEKSNDEQSRKKGETSQAPRLSVKDRLGVKVDDDDRVVKMDRNKSRSVSPFSRRGNEVARNYGLGERRVEVVERRRYEDRNRHRDNRNPRRDFHREDHSRRGETRRRDTSRRRDEKKSETKKERSKSESKTRQDDEIKKDKRKRSHSRSESDEKKRKKKEKKPKKDKVKKHQKDEEDKLKEEKSDEILKPKAIADKRKPTIDEASFVPDYDLESESEKEDVAKKEKLKVEEKKSSSSSESSDSSSGDERRKKRHRKHRKKRTRKESSSSSSESESDSSDDDRDKKRKKHKRKQKKKKRSKHK